MCVILACEKELPTRALLKSCEVANPHGAGIAWLDKNKKVHYEKGIDADKIADMIDNNKISLPCIVHFRIASVGTSKGDNGKLLTHPFEISDDSKLRLSHVMNKNSDGVLFHNGTISEHADILKDTVMFSNKKMLKGVYSDSRIMSFVLAQYGHEFIEIVGDTSYNKYAILDKNGIHKYGTWYSDNKIKSSNTYYKVNDVKEFSYGGYEFPYSDYGIDSLNDKDTIFYRDACEQRESIVSNVDGLKHKQFFQHKQISQNLDKEIKKIKSKKKQKRERRENIQFLKKLNWVFPERLSNDDLVMYVEQHRKNTKSINDAEKHQQSKAPIKLTLNDYESLYRINSEWTPTQEISGGDC